MKDSLGDRIKQNYEVRTRTYLTRRTHTLLRLDGKAFHTYTKGSKKPFDDGLMEDMDKAAEYLCKNIMGAKMAYVQSDEITVLFTDFDELSTQMWFDGEVQKITSVAASMVTRAFNEARLKRLGADGMKWAEFDCRVFQVPEREEVVNVFLWRQQDAVRNSVSMVTQNLYSPSQLHKKNMGAMQEMIFQKGVNWNNYEPRYKRGRVVVRESFEKNGVTRSKWVTADCPSFSKERDFILSRIPFPNTEEKVNA